MGFHGPLLAPSYVKKVLHHWLYWLMQNRDVVYIATFYSSINNYYCSTVITIIIEKWDGVGSSFHMSHVHSGGNYL